MRPIRWIGGDSHSTPRDVITASSSSGIRSFFPCHSGIGVYAKSSIEKRFVGRNSYVSRPGLKKAIDGPIPCPQSPTEWQPMMNSTEASARTWLKPRIAVKPAATTAAFTSFIIACAVFPARAVRRITSRMRTALSNAR